MTLEELSRLLDRYRITDGKGFRLHDHDTAHTGGLEVTREESETLLAAGVARLSEMQERLYAQDRWAVLCVFQAMDAAGKDGAIKHVLSGLNPQGVVVTSFKVPEKEDLDHDFLWRVHRALPRRGMIGIFNRSHYEEVLVVRVHPELLAHQRLPQPVLGQHLWGHRLADIVAFEQYLARQGTVILKFFLNLSKAEQRRRLLARLEDPNKLWKFDPADLAERAYWKEYRDAYEAAIAATAAPHAPWFVVPADHKWFAHLVVASVIVEALTRLDLGFPQPDAALRRRLGLARRQLEAEA